MVRRPDFIFLACQLCDLGKFASFSERVSHLFSGSLPLRCLVRKKGDSVSKVFGTYRMVVPFGLFGIMHLFAFLLFYPTRVYG